MPDVRWTRIADPVSVPARPLDMSGPALSPPPSPASAFPWIFLLKLLLLGGGAVACARLTWGLWSTHQVLRRSREVDAVRLVELAEGIRRSIGCRRVGLRASTEISSAATVGWRRPVLILAADWSLWSEQELRAVLAHEMTHVRSSDYLTGMVARVAIVLYFYHPLVRWLGTRFFLAQEAVADAAAARFVGGRADYLAALGRIALRQDRQLESLPVLAFATSFTTLLLRRIEMLETKDGRRVRGMRSVQWAALGCLCLGAVAVSALRAPAENMKVEAEASAQKPSTEAATSADADTRLAVRVPPSKGEALPPLPKSAVFNVLIDYEDGPPPRACKRMVLGPHRTREELWDGNVSISDGGRSLYLNLEDKEARLTEYADAPERPGFLERLRTLLTDAPDKPAVKRQTLGESQIDGRRAIGYRIAEPGKITTIWADPRSLLPIQVEIELGLYPDSKTIYNDFVFNVDLDESLFSLEPPADYTVSRRQVDGSLPDENALIASLCQYREHPEGTFPETLDGLGSVDLIRRRREALGEEPTARQLEEHSKFARIVQRGPWFALNLPPEADAHYAGRGVKVDAADTPVFWYRPEGKGNYRVIRADMSVIETDSPPIVPGSRALADWDKGERPSQRPWRNLAAAYNLQNLTPLVRQLGIVPLSLRNELEIRVLPGSAAEKAGLRSGDRITALNGTSVECFDDVVALWALFPFHAKEVRSLVRDGLPLVILRDKEQVAVTLPGETLQPFLNPTARHGGE